MSLQDELDARRRRICPLGAAGPRRAVRRQGRRIAEEGSIGLISDDAGRCYSVRNWKFESSSLQRRVRCEPDFLMFDTRHRWKQCGDLRLACASHRQGFVTLTLSASMFMGMATCWPINPADIRRRNGPA